MIAPQNIKKIECIELYRREMAVEAATEFMGERRADCVIVAMISEPKFLMGSVQLYSYVYRARL